MAKSYSIPFGMAFRRFYCCKCGTRFKRNPITRTVRPGDPDYLKHCRSGNKYVLMGDIELTEYNFKCPSCEHEIDYHAQCTIREIQKILGRHTLSDEEVKQHRAEAKKSQEKRQKVTEIAVIAAVIVIACVAVIVTLASKGQLT